MLGDGDCGRYAKGLLTGQPISDVSEPCLWGRSGGSGREWLNADELQSDMYDLYILHVEYSEATGTVERDENDALLRVYAATAQSTLPKALIINLNNTHWLILAPPMGGHSVPLFGSNGASNLLWPNGAAVEHMLEIGSANITRVELGWLLD